jgi:hypothetical protein
MVQTVQQQSIPAPGGEGLNSEMSPFMPVQGFALEATNAVIDRVGRLASRKAFTEYSDNSSISEDFDVVRMCRVEGDLGKEYTFGLAGFDRTGGDIRVPISYLRDGITDAPWEYGSYQAFQINPDRTVQAIPEIAPSHGFTDAMLVPFEGKVYVFSKGEPVMVWDGTTAEKLSDKAGFLPPQDDTGVIAADIDGDVATAAFGRLWVSGVNDDYSTIYYSDLLFPEQWYDGKGTATDEQNTAGIIDVSQYWPTGDDRIQGLAAHNGYLIVFGLKSILIYSGADGDPAGEQGLKLEDAIRDVGLVNQDAMCNVSTDHLFVDSLGVRSLGRVIQEKSTPLGEPSMNVASVIRERIELNRDTVRLFHLPSESMAVCLFPKDRGAYVFRLGNPSATGGFKATYWSDCDFLDGLTAKTEISDMCLLAGMDSRGITQYAGYVQPSPYTFSYETTALGNGNITQTMIPKSVSYSFLSAETGNIMAKWGFGQNMSYQRRLRPKKNQSLDPDFYTTTTSLNGSGAMLRVGFDIEIDGEASSVQQITVNLVTGRGTL